MPLARRIGLFILKLALITPVLFWLWGGVQPRYSAAITWMAGAVIGLEEHGERVSRLQADGGFIHLYSGLREDGRPADTYKADVLHFYLVPSLAVVLAFPGLAWRRRLAALGGVGILLALFHTLALAVAVEQSYAGVLALVAQRNYTASEAAAYQWLNDSALYFAIQAIPAAVLVGLAALSGFLRLPGPRPPLRPPRNGGPPGRRRGRLPGGAVVAATVVLISVPLLYAGSRHMEKVHFRQSEQICARGYAILQVGRVEEAAALFRRAIGLKPSFAHAHAGLGHALSKGKRPAEAAASFATALELDDTEPTWHLALSGELMNAGRAGEAVRLSAAAVERWPARGDLRLRLARLLAAVGRPCEGAPHLEAYLREEPDGSRADMARAGLEEIAERCGDGAGATRARP